MTRHNVGFALIDAFAKAMGAEWSNKSKFHAHIAEITVDGETIILAKPTTYYNETGSAARALKDFYKTNDILVIHDDLALPFGTIRVRSKGSDAGNNGIKSLNTHLGEDYRRIRIGMWNEQRHQIDDMNFVMSKLTHDEQHQFDMVIREVNSLLALFIKGELQNTSLSIA